MFEASQLANANYKDQVRMLEDKLREVGNRVEELQKVLMMRRTGRTGITPEDMDEDLAKADTEWPS